MHAVFDSHSHSSNSNDNENLGLDIVPLPCPHILAMVQVPCKEICLALHMSYHSTPFLLYMILPLLISFLNKSNSPDNCWRILCGSHLSEKYICYFYLEQLLERSRDRWITEKEHTCAHCTVCLQHRSCVVSSDHPYSKSSSCICLSDLYENHQNDVNSLIDRAFLLHLHSVCHHGEIQQDIEVLQGFGLLYTGCSCDSHHPVQQCGCHQGDSYRDWMLALE